MKSRNAKQNQPTPDEQFNHWCSQWEKNKGVFEGSPKPFVPTPQYGPEDFYGNFNPAKESEIRDVDAEYWNRVSGAVRGNEAPDPDSIFSADADESGEWEFVPDSVEVLTEAAEAQPVGEITEEEFVRMRAAGMTGAESLGKVNATLAEWVESRRQWLEAWDASRRLILRTMPKDWKINCDSLNEAMDETAQKLAQEVYRLAAGVFQGSSPFSHQSHTSDRYPLRRWREEAGQFREAAELAKRAMARAAKTWGVSLNESMGKKSRRPINEARKPKELFKPVDAESYEEDESSVKARAKQMIRSLNPIEYPSAGKDQRPHITPWSGGKQLAEVEKVKRELEKLEVRAHTMASMGKMSESRKVFKKLELLQKKLDELSDLMSPDQSSDYQS